ncbi:hypothetical protein HYH02_005301 [Chlamydomonas schloesseri]|uniref:Uncharacterized protein n=1 Tax=Chlamydomonas schloesseri TaxID=2026947 RepID=A0A835WLV9_9CHLO|nr:hypothetical protein HYH02_005301 [Chlamydomonas schloesseri]|eukprot:KAG2449777.1 hypothetical protein HYH02_005301 [Chlamydomonas schloesseri]
MHPHVVAAAAGDPLGDGHTGPPREEVLGHLKRFAARTGLLPCIRLNTSLVRARYTRMNCEWRLGLRDAVTGRSWQCSADVLVLCRSAVAAPRPPPPLPGQHTFEGQVVEVEASAALDTANARHLDSRLDGKHVVVLLHPGAANAPHRRPTATPPPTGIGAAAAGGPSCKDACRPPPAAGDAAVQTELLAAPAASPTVEALRRLCLAAVEHVGSGGSVTLVLEEERPSAGTTRTTRTSATAELGLGLGLGLGLAPAWNSSLLTPPARVGVGVGSGADCGDVSYSKQQQQRRQLPSSPGRTGLFSGCFGGACFGRDRRGEPAQPPVAAGSRGECIAAACEPSPVVAAAAAAGEYATQRMTAGSMGAEAVVVDAGYGYKAEVGGKVTRDHATTTCTSSGFSAGPPEWTAELEAAGVRLVLGCPAALQCGCLVLADGTELPGGVVFAVFSNRGATPQAPQPPQPAGTALPGAKATCTPLEASVHIDLRFLECAGGGGASAPRQRTSAPAAPGSAGGAATTNPNNGTGSAAAGMPSAASLSSFRKLRSHLSLYSLAAGGDSFDSRVEATDRSVRAAGGRAAAPFAAGDVLTDLYRGMLCTSEAAPNLVLFGEVRPRDHCAVTVALQAHWLAHFMCSAADVAAAAAAAGTGVDSDMGRGGEGGSRRHSRTASTSAPAAAAAPMLYVRQPSPAEAASDAAERAALWLHTPLVGRPLGTPGQLAAYQRLLLQDLGLQVEPVAVGVSSALHSLKQALSKLLSGGKTAAAAARQPLAPRRAARLLRVRPPPHMTRDEYLDAMEQHVQMKQQQQQLQGAAVGAAVWGAASAAAMVILAGGCADGDRGSAVSRGTSGGLWAYDPDSRATSGRGTPSNMYSTRLSLVTDVDAADFEASALAAGQLGPLLGAGGSPLMRPPASTHSPSVGAGPGPSPGAGLRSVSASVPGFGSRPSLQLSRRSLLCRSPLAPPQQQQPQQQLASGGGAESPWESPSRLSRQQQQLAMLQHASASAGGTASPPRSAASPSGFCGTRHHSVSGRPSQPLLHQSPHYGGGGAPASLGSPGSTVPRRRSQRTSTSGLLLLEAAAGRSSAAAAAAAILRRERSRSNAGNSSPVWAAYAAAAAAAAGGDRSSAGGIPVGRGFSGSGGLLLAAAYGAVATGSRNNSRRQLRRGISGTGSGGGVGGGGTGVASAAAASEGPVSAAAAGPPSSLVDPNDVSIEMGGTEERIAGLPLSTGGSGPTSRTMPDMQQHQHQHQQPTASEWEPRQAAALQSPGGNPAPLTGLLGGGRGSATDLFSITEHRHEGTGGEGLTSQNYNQGLGHASGRQAVVASVGSTAADDGKDAAGTAAAHTTILPATPAPAAVSAACNHYERRPDASPSWSPGRPAAPGIAPVSAGGGGGGGASRPDLRLTLSSPPLQLQQQPLPSHHDGAISPLALSVAVPHSPTAQSGRGAAPSYSTTSAASAGPPVHGGLPNTSFTRPPSRLSIAGVSGPPHPFPSIGSPPLQHHLQYPIASPPAGSLHAQQQQQRRRTTIGAPGLGSAFAGSAGAAAALVATGAAGQAGGRQSEPGRLAALTASAVNVARAGGGPAAAATCRSVVSVPSPPQQQPVPTGQAASAALSASAGSSAEPSLSSALSAYLTRPLRSSVSSSAGGEAAGARGVEAAPPNQASVPAHAPAAPPDGSRELERKAAAPLASPPPPAKQSAAP